jgi:hypothetical protein
MSKIVFKSVYQKIIMILLLALSIAASTGAADVASIGDTVELVNGDKITGTLLTKAFTVTSPYSLVTVEKSQISEIRINDGYQNHDVIELKEGGLVEGTIEENELSLKPSSGKIITLEKKKCKKIIMRSNE